MVPQMTHVKSHVNTRRLAPFRTRVRMPVCCSVVGKTHVTTEERQARQWKEKKKRGIKGKKNCLQLHQRDFFKCIFNFLLKAWLQVFRNAWFAQIATQLDPLLVQSQPSLGGGGATSCLFITRPYRGLHSALATSVHLKCSEETKDMHTFCKAPAWVSNPQPHTYKAAAPTACRSPSPHFDVSYSFSVAEELRFAYRTAHRYWFAFQRQLLNVSQVSSHHWSTSLHYGNVWIEPIHSLSLSRLRIDWRGGRIRDASVTISRSPLWHLPLNSVHSFKYWF